MLVYLSTVLVLILHCCLHVSVIHSLKSTVHVHVKLHTCKFHYVLPSNCMYIDVDMYPSLPHAIFEATVIKQLFTTMQYVIFSLMCVCALGSSGQISLKEAKLFLIGYLVSCFFCSKILCH